MQIFEKEKSIKEYLSGQKKTGIKVGFVPTMGALHEGHTSLIKAATQDNDITVSSIFVNPTQFNDPSDLVKYPRTPKQDLAMLEASGCDVVFMPSEKEMYSSAPVLKFNFGPLENVMEGKYRPGHFNGVGVVVSKFFNIIKPENAYFGQKDLQQFAIIRQLVNDLSFDLNLICCPIVREPDGLAMSSRNRRLASAERDKAPLLYKELQNAKQNLLNGIGIEETKEIVFKNLSSEHLIKLDYFEIVDRETLNNIETIDKNKKTALCIAAFLGDVRLIDNILLFS